MGKYGSTWRWHLSRAVFKDLLHLGEGGFPKALTKKKIVHMKGTCENDTKTEI